MAMTETRPETETETANPVASPSDGAPRPAGGLAGVLGTGRHRSIGRLWVGTSLVFLALSGGLGEALGSRRLQPDHYGAFSADNFSQSLSLHGISGVFLFAIPVLVGLATIVVPRQVGMHTIAFPRAAAAAFWAYLVGGGLLVVSYLINGGPFGGSSQGVDLFIASLALVVIAILLASVCIASTIVALRAPNLTLARVPFFTFSMLVASTIWIASLGVLLGLLVLFYIDIHYGAQVFASADDLALWLRWTVTPPQIFAFAIPVLGFIADAVPVAARTRARMYGAQLVAIGAFGALSFGAWTFFEYKEPKLTQQALYVGVAFAILLPLLALTAAVADTLRVGRVRVTSPLLFAVSALLMLLAGAASGAIHAVKGFELVGTSEESAIIHLVFGAIAVAAVGAIHYWWPHVLTRPLNENLARLNGALLLIGVLALSVPDVISGFFDQPAGSLYSGVVPEDKIKLLDGISFAGGIVVGLAIVLFVVNLAVSMAKDVDGEVEDPWEGHTLEWSHEPVPVASSAPLLDAREATA